MSTSLVKKEITLLNGIAKETSETGEIHLLRITDELLEPRSLSKLIYVPVDENGKYIESRDHILFVNKEEDGVFIYPPDQMGEVVLVLALIEPGNIFLKRKVSENTRIVDEQSEDGGVPTQHQYEQLVLSSWLDNNPFDLKIHGNSCIGNFYAHS